MQRTTLGAALVASLALACAGPSGGSGAAAESAISGTVTGVGALSIDGAAYDGAGAAVTVDRADPTSPAAGTLADFKLGCQVDADAAADGGGHLKLRSLVVRAALRGPVDAVDAAGHTFAALGQTVLVASGTSADTVFEGVAGLADLKAGDLVEVHGTFDASGAILATRVELEPAPAGDPLRLRVSGFVSGLDAAGTSFRLGNLQIDAAQARVVPRDAKLAEGALVYVFATALPQAGVLAARAVRVATLPVEGQRVVLGGRVSAFTALTSFVVRGVPVDASGATITGGQASDIQVGALVRVEGTVHVASAGPPPSFSVVATRVHLLSSHDQGPPPGMVLVLGGQVKDYVAADGTFTLHGVKVALSAETAFVRGALADLADGKWVAVKGQLVSGVLQAAQLVFLPALPVPMPMPH